MCLILLSYNQYADYPLILAANRDEFYNRPTKAAHIWNTSPKILAGKDQKEGGTWLGISETGRLAALTNHRKMDTIKEDTISRGIIVKDFLTYEGNPLEYLEKLQSNGEKYNGFNLIAGDIDNLQYLSNRTVDIQKLTAGNHVLSNAFLNTPWPKAKESLHHFEKHLEAGKPDEDQLFSILQIEKRYPLESLPKTGLPKQMEKAVSSVFIKTENYGTRSSTVVIVDANGRVSFTEKTYIPGTTTEKKIVRQTFEL